MSVLGSGGGGGSVDSEAMRIDSSQRVGIGVSSPAVTLEAKSSGNSVFRAWTSDTATSNQIVFDNISNYNYGVIGTVSGNSTATGDVFGLGYTAAYATDFTPVLSWTANTGRVGIGTTSPQFDCTVSKQGTGVTSYIGIRAGENGSASTSNAAVLYYRIRGGGPGDVDANITYSYNGAYLLQSSSQDGYTWNTSAGEAVRIDSSRRLLVGTSTARANFFNTTIPALSQVETSGEGLATASFTHNANSTTAPSIILAKTRGTAVGSTTIVQNGDGIGTIYFQGSDGTEFVEAASIQCLVDDTPGANDMPGRLAFSTTANGAAGATVRFTIACNGDHRFSNTNDVHPQPDNAVRLGFSGGRWSAVWAATGTIQTSDGRAKTEVTNAVLGSDFINSLRPVSYKWIEGGKRDTGERDPDGNWIYESVPGTRTHWGFIAQEVKEAVDAAGVDFGGYVLTDKDNPDSQQALRYDQFIAPLTKALQETMAELKALKAEVAALKAQ